MLHQPQPPRYSSACTVTTVRRIAAMIAAGTALAACGGQTNQTPADSVAAAPNPAGRSPAQLTFTAAQVTHGGVKWSPVVATEIASTTTLPAQLVPDGDRTASLGAPAQGRIVTVHVRLGEKVRVGQALVTLESQAASIAMSDYDKATAEVASRRAAATYAQTARARADRLLAIKAGSRQEAERAAADDELAKANVAQAEAELARARASISQLGATNKSGTMILRSPIAGVVLSRDASPGSVAEAGALLVTVSNPATLWLEMAASDRAAASIRLNARVRFAVTAFPADTFEARVQSVGGALDTITRTVPIRARVSNASGRLRAAMFSTAWIESGARRQAVVLPDSAIQLLDNRSVVFVAVPDGKGGARFERRDVEVATTVGGQSQVISGVRAGDTVVIAGAFAVKSEFARSKMVEG